VKVLYLWPMLPPKLPQTEALSQEIGWLGEHFGRELVYLNPNQHLPLRIPRLFFGWHRWPHIRQREAAVDLHHLYNPDPFPYPILRALRRPVVYSITGGIGHRTLNPRFLNALAAVTVYDEASLAALQAAGVRNGVLIRPGIDVTRFTHQPKPLDRTMRLMIASAPWTAAQFRTKGVDALLAAAQQVPRLHLVFLWRGVLLEEMLRRVHALNLADRVTVLDGQQDVNQVLGGVHASIVLAADPRIIKAYPHSLLDSLAAGKPVLISRAIPMARYVEQTGCGEVVEGVTPAAILAAVDRLIANYPAAQAAAQARGRQDFSHQAMVAAFAAVYQRVRRSL
jgi:glycosyltransferase involved in cell wall biosynthesis